MADVKQWPWLLNQPFPEDMGYPAEIVRGQHFDSTSGGNGVSSPRALKVQAQPAPDGTVQILPGGGTAVSNYAGVENQSYQATNFKPYTLDIPPTGSSSGGRHDLIIQRFLDPQYEKHPGADGELTPEVAATLDFWWFEVFEGRAADTKFSFPHVKLAHIKRPANTTIVEDSHITDLRELANPKSDWHVEGRNINIAETESLHTGSEVWPSSATHYARFPEFATRMQISAGVEMARAHATAGDRGIATGNFLVYFVHPDGTEIRTQQTDWRTSGDEDREKLNILLSHQLAVPAKFRGEDIRIEFRARKYGGPNVYADGATSYKIQIYFEQEIA